MKGNVHRYRIKMISTADLIERLDDIHNIHFKLLQI